MTFKKVKEYIKNGNTLLSVGSMSLNVLDVAIDIADEKDIPIQIIASRR